MNKVVRWFGYISRQSGNLMTGIFKIEASRKQKKTKTINLMGRSSEGRCTDGDKINWRDIVKYRNRWMQQKARTAYECGN